MTLKEMKAIAKENGYSVDYIFRHGLNSLLSAKQGLKNDRENPIKYQIDRIIHNMNEIQIAENVLREWYGITFCSIDTERANVGQMQIYNGIDEVAEALNIKPKETNEWRLAKEFNYQWINFVQLAERNSKNYLKAFDATAHYSTTYEKAYGKAKDDEQGN